MQIVSPATKLRWLIVAFGLALSFPASPLWASTSWFKGSTHCHTTWSDGDATAANVTAWYKNYGYNFLVLTDHNYLDPAAVTTLGATYNAPGEFLLMPGEEITTSYSGKQIHINGLNLAAKITPVGGTSVADTINKNIALVTAQAASYGRPMLSHINHPSWPDYNISPEDIAQAAGTRCFEVLNCYPANMHFNGDSTHPGTEKMWDIASTIRMVNMGMLPMFGVASDDAHNYSAFDFYYANPGRGFVMVRAEALSANSLINAMNNGDFYFSNGVELATLDFNRTTGVLSVAVEPKAGATYNIDFIGTPVGADPTKQADGSYSADVGKLLATVQGASASYTLTGDELYVRARVRSDHVMSNPIEDLPYEYAWTQPVGGWLLVPEPTASIMLCGMAAIGTIWCSLKWRRKKP